MLGRAGIDTTVIDPHPEYPAEFRCEKLDGDQVALLKKTGLAEPVLRVTTPDRESWIARFGRLVDKRTGDQEGIFYGPLVNTIRAEIPSHVRFIQAKATTIASGAEHRGITLSTGETVSARLLVLANGLSVSLRDQLGIKREVMSECHSISIGFDVTPVGRRGFPFPALTYYADRTSDRAAYITLFPIGGTMRANMFVYRDMKDPWLQQLRAEPEKTVMALMPGLRRITGDFAVDGRITIRPVDLYVTREHVQPGLVLVGDAFSTSCPAAGTGARKVLVDVERLCNGYIPQWLATPGMDTGKIAAFYADPEKQACEAFCINKAHALKAFSIDPSLRWAARRWTKFLGHYGVGTLRRFARRPLTPPTGRHAVPAGAKP
jgi:2-polyprenyl-6-methoxyphenol hydroxylase-like FAD-dependent oxidoreductase